MLIANSLLYFMIAESSVERFCSHFFYLQSRQLLYSSTSHEILQMLFMIFALSLEDADTAQNLKAGEDNILYQALNLIWEFQIDVVHPWTLQLGCLKEKEIFTCLFTQLIASSNLYTKVIFYLLTSQEIHMRQAKIHTFAAGRSIEFFQLRQLMFVLISEYCSLLFPSLVLFPYYLSIFELLILLFPLLISVPSGVVFLTTSAFDRINN